MPPKHSLPETLASTDAILSRFLDALSPSSSPSTSALPNQSTTTTRTTQRPPPPLPLLNDSARLLKAHVTKLSLLAINKPFTPSAIAAVLGELAASCLPAMMGAVQTCEARRDAHGAFFVAEVRARVRRVMREVLGLTREVRVIAEAAAGAGSAGKAAAGAARKGGGAAGGSGRDSLSATGVVWDGCDEVVALCGMGAGGLAVAQAEAYRDTLRDAIGELREWREGADTEHEGREEDGLLDSEDEGVDGDRDSLDDVFNAANSLPKDRAGLRRLVAAAEEVLKKVVILYAALVKRRLKVFPKVAADAERTEHVRRLDDVMGALKSIPDMVDELADVFYNLDEDAARGLLVQIVEKARSTAALADQNFQGKEDEFTLWSQKWRDAVSRDGVAATTADPQST